MQTETGTINTIKKLEKLVESSRILSSTLDVMELLEALTAIASDLTSSESASILLYNKKTLELRFEVLHGKLNEKARQLRVPVEGSVAGWVINNQRPLIIQDAASDARVFREVDKKLNFQTSSLIAVPLLRNNKIIGVLEAVNKKSNSNYTEDDITILEMLAAQAAIAIENAQLVEQLRLANSQLVHHDKVKSDFIAIASHELRTPLGLILGHTTFLKELVPTQHQEQIDVIIRSAMRLKAIIEDLSTMAHKETGQARIRPSSFSMSQLVREVAQSFQEKAAEKNIELGFDVPADTPLNLEADKDKITIVLTNIIRNALSFTDSGGQIGVKVESDSGFVKVYVVDTGIGIPEDELDRVFNRFYQVESHLTRRHGGMGLGLSIAQAMVELHQGKIWVESKVGMGSLFCFMLPVSKQKAAAAARVFKT